jgi:hypothetical protein
VELASSAGVIVATDQTVQVPLTWTPGTEGPTQLYAKVILTGEQNELNDSSPLLPITVMPAGMLVVTIGTGTELGRIPVDMFYKNSLFETLYYPTEIGAFGNITAIAFFNNFVTDLPAKRPRSGWVRLNKPICRLPGFLPVSLLWFSMARLTIPAAKTQF